MCGIGKIPERLHRGGNVRGGVTGRTVARLHLVEADRLSRAVAGREVVEGGNLRRRQRPGVGWILRGPSASGIALFAERPAAAPPRGRKVLCVNLAVGEAYN